MNQNACLTHCRICTKRLMDAQTGLVCGLTKAKPDFHDLCPSFEADAKELTYYKQREQQAAAAETETAGYFALEEKGVKKGVVGGIVMMAIALVWFFGGLAAGYIFYYPPFLFVFGVYALVKGLITKNFSGSQHS